MSGHKTLQQNMNDYYNARAQEYDEIYAGIGYTSIPDPNAYKQEVKIVSDLIGKHIRGRQIDIACGTGFWLPSYASNCPEIFLIDQSENMVSECMKKIKKLAIEDKCKIIRDDFFRYKFEESIFDNALIGSLLSHFSNEQEIEFFNKLKYILKPEGEFIIIDSIWNEEKAKKRNKSGIQERPLNDGRKFKIYKRYFNRNDVEILKTKYSLELEIILEGRVFIGLKGRIKADIY